jgi:dCMP deaminase
MHTIERPSWDERFMMDAIGAATRSSCLLRQVGAALVLDKHVIASGYNGAPPDTESCLDTGVCYYQDMAYRNSVKIGRSYEDLKEEHKQFCKAIHAEKNAFNQCTRRGISPEGAKLYITNFPCPPCVRDVVIPNKISEIVIWKDYLNNPLLDDDEYSVSKRWLDEARIPIRKMDLSEGRIMQIATLMISVGGRLSYKFAPTLTLHSRK